VSPPVSVFPPLYGGLFSLTLSKSEIWKTQGVATRNTYSVFDSLSGMNIIADSSGMFIATAPYVKL